MIFFSSIFFQSFCKDLVCSNVTKALFASELVSSRISCTLFVSPNDVENKSRMVNSFSQSGGKPVTNTVAAANEDDEEGLSSSSSSSSSSSFPFSAAFRCRSKMSFCVCLWTNSGRMKDPCGYIFTRSSPTSVVSFRPLLFFFVVVVVPIFPILLRRN